MMRIASFPVASSVTSSPTGTPFSPFVVSERWVWASIVGKRERATRVSGTCSMLRGSKSLRARGAPAGLATSAASASAEEPLKLAVVTSPAPRPPSHRRRLTAMGAPSIVLPPYREWRAMISWTARDRPSALSKGRSHMLRPNMTPVAPHSM